jgi:hypothetical protein
MLDIWVLAPVCPFKRDPESQFRSHTAGKNGSYG